MLDSFDSYAQMIGETVKQIIEKCGTTRIYFVGEFSKCSLFDYYFRKFLLSATEGRA